MAPISMAARKSLTEAQALTMNTTPLHTSKQVYDITVLLGGPSSEREVSIKSGTAVAAALERLGHRVYRADISPDNLKALTIPADLVFIALHGTFGEDGQLQQILEERGIRYVGSSAAASRQAMNKVASKEQFIRLGVPTPGYEVVTRENINRIHNGWKLPVVIKPIDQGSSVDTCIVRDAFGFQSALQRVVHKYGSCLIEEYIRGRELTVGILGDLALPVCEIRTPREFYDYTAKYLVDTTEYLFDIDLPAELLEKVQQLSLQAFRAVDGRDFSRVDWMIDQRTLQPFALEVNTIPGFTDHSLLPKAAERVGISFDQLCQRIVEMALRRGQGA
ncbi:MAG: D-alanine--D-alanine ligase [Phycisphaerae bacterium]|nr:D-alanine--D-alanine ligase [Phycisphaerae bacterium]